MKAIYRHTLCFVVETIGDFVLLEDTDTGQELTVRMDDPHLTLDPTDEDMYEADTDGEE